MHYEKDEEDEEEAAAAALMALRDVIPTGTTGHRAETSPGPVPGDDGAAKSIRNPFIHPPAVHVQGPVILSKEAANEHIRMCSKRNCETCALIRESRQFAVHEALKAALKDIVGIERWRNAATKVAAAGGKQDDIEAIAAAIQWDLTTRPEATSEEKLLWETARKCIVAYEKDYKREAGRWDYQKENNLRGKLLSTLIANNGVDLAKNRSNAQKEKEDDDIKTFYYENENYLSGNVNEFMKSFRAQLRRHRKKMRSAPAAQVAGQDHVQQARERQWQQFQQEEAAARKRLLQFQQFQQQAAARRQLAAQHNHEQAAAASTAQQSGGTGLVQVRFDPADGGAYTKEEFVGRYGGTNQWDAAEATAFMGQSTTVLRAQQRAQQQR